MVPDTLDTPQKGIIQADTLLHVWELEKPGDICGSSQKAVPCTHAPPATDAGSRAGSKAPLTDISFRCPHVRHGQYTSRAVYLGLYESGFKSEAPSSS